MGRSRAAARSSSRLNAAVVPELARQIRLRALSGAILVDLATRAELDGAFAIEALGPVAFRGKALPVEVFAVTTA